MQRVFSVSRIVLCGFAVVLGAAGIASAQEESAADEGAWITSIAPLGEGGKFAASTANGLLLRPADVVAFELQSPDQFTTLYQHPAAVWRVVSLDGGATIASVDYRGNLMTYDVSGQTTETHEQAFGRWCQAMIVSPDGKSLVAGNEAGEVMVWDLAAKKIVTKVQPDQHAVTALAFSPDQARVAVADGAGHVHFLGWPSLDAIGQIEVGEETAWSVAFVEDGSKLLIGSGDRNLYRADAQPGAQPESLLKGGDWITHIAISPGGEVAVGEIGGAVRFPFAGPDAPALDAPSGVWALAWNGSSQLLAGTRKDGIVVAGRTWTWATPAAEESGAGEAGDE